MKEELSLYPLIPLTFPFSLYLSHPVGLRLRRLFSSGNKTASLACCLQEGQECIIEREKRDDDIIDNVAWMILMEERSGLTNMHKLYTSVISVIINVLPLKKKKNANYTSPSKFTFLIIFKHLLMSHNDYYG